MTRHLTNEELIDYLHESLSPQADARALAHLEQCAQCRSEYDAEAALSEALREHARATEREFPATLKAQIWSRVRSEEPSPWARFVAAFRPAIAVPVAAALAVGLYFGVNAMNGNGPSIEAAYYLQDHAAMTGTTPFSDRNTMPADLETTATLTNQTPVAVEAVQYTADAVGH